MSGELVLRVGRVTFPEMRLNVFEAVCGLADAADRQRLKAGRDRHEPAFYDDLTNAVNVFDDMLGSDAAALVGSVIEDSEVVALGSLQAALSDVVAELGDRPDADYLADPRWPKVAKAAGAARDAMSTSAA